MTSSLSPVTPLEILPLLYLCIAAVISHQHILLPLPFLFSLINIMYLSAFCLSFSVRSSFPFCTIAFLSCSCQNPFTGVISLLPKFCIPIFILICVIMMCKCSFIYSAYVDCCVVCIRFSLSCCLVGLGHKLYPWADVLPS